MLKSHHTYALEFRAEAIRLVRRRGKPIAETPAGWMYRRRGCICGRPKPRSTRACTMTG